MSPIGPRTALRGGIIGLLAGFAGGLFGVGGGVLIVPGLVLWLGARQHQAHATSVAAIVVVAAASAGRFALAGSVDWGAAAIMFLGAGLGAYLGARLLSFIPEIWLAAAFVALALISVARLALFE